MQSNLFFLHDHANWLELPTFLINIFLQEGFLSDIGDIKGVQHIIILSQVFISPWTCLLSDGTFYLVRHGLIISLQLAAYKGSSGIQALMNSKARKLAERDEAAVIASGIPYTIIRAGLLQNNPGGEQGFSFREVIFIFLLFSVFPYSRWQLGHSLLTI